MKIIKIRPHHLLDILRDSGNQVKRSSHPYGASLKEIANDLLSDIDQNIRLVSRVDSICLTCSMLKENICSARLNDDLLMRDYNDDLDDKLFDVMEITPESNIVVRDFLKIIDNNITTVLAKFSSPTNIPEVRKTGTILALKKLGIR